MNINVFAIFLDSNFNDTLANNFVKFWTTGPWILNTIPTLKLDNESKIIY